MVLQQILPNYTKRQVLADGGEQREKSHDGWGILRPRYPTVFPWARSNTETKFEGLPSMQRYCFH